MLTQAPSWGMVAAIVVCYLCALLLDRQRAALSFSAGLLLLLLYGDNALRAATLVTWLCAFLSGFYHAVWED